MIQLVEFMVAFTLMVALATVVIGLTIGATMLLNRLGWEFRRNSLAREAQAVLVRERARRQGMETA